MATGEVSDGLAGGNGHHGGQPLHPKHAGNIGGGIGVGVPEYKRIMTGLGQVGEVGAQPVGVLAAGGADQHNDRHLGGTLQQLILHILHG